MISIAHIINPFLAEESSDLYSAQPITFESMRRAREKSHNEVSVELCCTLYEEDLQIAPEGFKVLSNLNYSVLDYGEFTQKRKLPLIREIMNLAFLETDAEYIIYTNVDIGIQENFYNEVSAYINEGIHSMIINRRRISGKYQSIGELNEIYEEKGKKHPGFDCFIIKRSLIPQMRFRNICIGVPFIGITFAQNIFALDKETKVFEHEYLTFHIGMEIFPGRAPREYFKHNQKEFWKCMDDLSNTLNIDHFPFRNLPLPFRVIKWGLNPSIPIRLVMKLLFKKYFSTKP